MRTGKQLLFVPGFLKKLVLSKLTRNAIFNRDYLKNNKQIKHQQPFPFMLL